MWKKIDKYLEENYLEKSYKQIAEELGEPYQRIRDRARRIGLKKHRKIKWTDEILEDIRKYYPEEGYRGAFFQTKYPDIPRTALQKKASTMGIAYIPKNTYISSSGYLEISFQDNGREYVKLLHRHIMEVHLGRELDPKEIVHHVDGDKLNNSLNNLAILTRAEHLEIHRRG